MAKLFEERTQEIYDQMIEQMRGAYAYALAEMFELWWAKPPEEKLVKDYEGFLKCFALLEKGGARPTAAKRPEGEPVDGEIEEAPPLTEEEWQVVEAYCAKRRAEQAVQQEQDAS